MSENKQYLNEQIITYLGNKRSLLNGIGDVLKQSAEKLNKEKLVTFDGFSGSGIVARYLKQYSSIVMANDMELYSKIINQCYLANPSSKQKVQIYEIIKRLNKEAENLTDKKYGDGIIRRLYSPKNIDSIKKGERVFYTPENARRLDFYAQEIQKLPEAMRPFIYGPLLYGASVNVNTSGVFKGFHKNKQGLGQFGGEGQVALNRILKPIILGEPIFSNYKSKYKIYQGDTAVIAKKIENIDIDFTYLDPPYNQHPYGSNYFMLNLLIEYKEPNAISEVSGIVEGWNRSAYNKKTEVLGAMETLITNLNSKFIAISYNNEGYISKKDFVNSLEKFGNVTISESKYPTYRGSRNLSSRETYVTEIIYLLEKKL